MPGLSATAGVHPHEAKDWSTDTERRLRALLARPAVVAVGETGLDYHYDHSPRPAQRLAFEAQLALAAELGKPVVVHAREADDDVAAVLRDDPGHHPAALLQLRAQSVRGGTGRRGLLFLQRHDHVQELECPGAC